MNKATTFEHGGKVYEVRAIPTLNGWKVRIFVEGIPANGFTYSVDSQVYQDAAIDGVPEDLVAGLMETAERDFRRGDPDQPGHIGLDGVGPLGPRGITQLLPCRLIFVFEGQFVEIGLVALLLVCRPRYRDGNAVVFNVSRLICCSK